jgi:putative sigma-54 modulation protein
MIYKGGSMNIELTIRHFEATDRVKEYVTKEVNKLAKYHEGIVRCKVVLDQTKEGEEAEISVHVTGKDFVISEITDDIFKSIDVAVEKITRQIIKFKEKRYSVNARGVNSR